MFQRILIPLDGSARAEQAFPVAVRIARATGASLTLLFVVEPPTRFDEYTIVPPEYSDELLEAEVTRAKAYLLHILETSTLEGIGITTEVRTGIVVQQILQYVEEHQNDLVVMCSHGTTGLKRWLLGSVAQKIAHTSPVPVLVVREGHELSMEQQGDKPFRVLVPLDGSSLAESALLPAAQITAALAAPQSGSLHLVQVVEPIAVMGDMTGAMAESNQELMLQAENYLKQKEQQLKEGAFAPFHLTVASETVPGVDAATVLLKMAKDGHIADSQKATQGSQMVVMSTHGRSGLAYWVMGSIAERVLSTTTLPMLIVRPAKEKMQQDHQPVTPYMTPLF